MGREGWIYAIAFLAILGVGAMIILPRLDRAGPADDEPYVPAYPTESDVDEAPREAGPGVEAFEGNPDYGWIPITVRGVGGPLRGPFRAVHGARVEAETRPDAGIQKIQVQPTAAEIRLGAAGHQWVTVSTLR